MQDRTPWLKITGGTWLIIGTIVMLWATISLLRGSLMGATAFSPDSVSTTLVIWPWAQITAIVGACFFLITGWGLFGRHRWVQTVMVPAHLLFMVYIIVVWVAAFLVQNSSSPGRSSVPVICAALILANGGVALFMNSVGTSEALSWLPLRTTPLVPLKCEYCGTPLDPRTNRCPECESLSEVAPNSVAPVPPHARLIGLSDETQFDIEPERTTVVGRGSTRNDVNLSNPTVSRHHAQIVYERGHYVLTALRDLNGTFINDTMVRQRALEDGDEVRFGRARFRFELMEIERDA
jgi:hypothetical protein